MGKYDTSHTENSAHIDEDWDDDDDDDEEFDADDHDSFSDKMREGKEMMQKQEGATTGAGLKNGTDQKVIDL